MESRSVLKWKKRKKERGIIRNKAGKNSQDSNYSLDSIYDKRKCTCRKKPVKEIPSEFSPLTRASQKKHALSRPTTKVNKRKSKKPLQERLQEHYPKNLDPCNIICLCQPDPQYYSTNLIRKVPPQPSNAPQLKKRKKRICKPRTITADPECECMHDNFTNEIPPEPKKSQPKNVCNSKAEISQHQYKIIECFEVESMCNCMKIEISNNEAESNCQLSKLEYETMECNQVESETNSEKSCMCHCMENVDHLSENDEKTEERLVPKKKAGDVTNTPKQVNDDKLNLSDQNTNKNARAPSFLKRCFCFMKKNKEKKKIRSSVIEGQCNCEIIVSNIPSNDSEYSCEKTETESDSKEKTDKDANCHCSRNSDKLAETEVTKNGEPKEFRQKNTTVDSLEADNKKKCVESPSNSTNSTPPSCFCEPENIRIYIGKSKATITIIRDSD